MPDKMNEIAEKLVRLMMEDQMVSSHIFQNSGNWSMLLFYERFSWNLTLQLIHLQ